MLRVDLRTTLPGVLTLEALPEHRLKVHIGSPVRGSCQLHRFLYTRGDVDILPAGLSDVWHEEDAGEALIVHLSPALLLRAANDMGLGGAGLAPRYQLKDAQIEHIAWALDAERRAGYPGGLLYRESLGMALAVHLLKHYARKGDPRLARVMAYIDAHLDEELSIARLAEVAGVSASHLKTLFRRSTGLAVHRYVVQRRVERARMLLEQDRWPASRVALEAGFAHQSHMARWLRRVG